LYLATIQQDGWELEDGEARHSESSDTFEIPAIEERLSLRPDQRVKLIFRIALRDEAGVESEAAERMWVEVKSKSDFYYSGTLDNDAYSTKEIRAGLPVLFQPRHVIQIYRKRN
jgi:hypothetical protein